MVSFVDQYIPKTRVREDCLLVIAFVEGVVVVDAEEAESDDDVHVDRLAVGVVVQAGRKEERAAG